MKEKFHMDSISTKEKDDFIVKVTTNRIIKCSKFSDPCDV